MHYQVPQFIEIEDRIIGPLTLKQFFLLLAPGAVVFILWFLLEFFLWVMVAVFLTALGLALAFLKISDRPFYKVILAALGYAAKPHLYLWQQLPTHSSTPAPYAPASSASALKKLVARINIFHN